MNPRKKKPDFSHALGGLKDFQRWTVDTVFRRLYGDEDPTRHFLVADEVGLGKTLVARGVIAKAIEHLWDDIGRIDIVYICSNAEIARQNIDRLKPNIEGLESTALPSRITLLPKTIGDLSNNKVNFISLTPGTSFDLNSATGLAEERVLLYHLLKPVWKLRGAAPLNVLRDRVGPENFRHYVRNFSAKVEPSLRRAFSHELRKHPDFENRFRDLCVCFNRHDRRNSQEERQERSRLIGELRSLLAATCLEALEPDLIILDEFQRFRHLIDGESEAARLARKLFSYADETAQARVLLLSATPYKMYTLADDSGEEDHYEDFYKTLGFLLDDGARLEEQKQLVEEYRREIYRLGNEGASKLHGLKSEIEDRLRKVMVRTERLAATEERDGMLAEVVDTGTRLSSDDPAVYLELHRVAEILEHHDVLEYWKSAPYLLSFMDTGYKLKRSFNVHRDSGGRAAELAEALRRCKGVSLGRAKLDGYEALDPGNARLRALFRDLERTEAWKLLWVPPSLPYYSLSGPFERAANQGFTKHLLFSSWRVVPKAVALMMSYEVER